MNELIERLEKASGASRALDCEIATAVGYRERGGYWRSPAMDNSDPPLKSCPEFTASLDAAMTLVPDELWWLIGRGQIKPDEPLYGAQIRKPGFSTGGHVVSDGEHNCMAIALCIAILKARQDAISSK